MSHTQNGGKRYDGKTLGIRSKKAEAAKKAEEIIAGAREQARANEEKAEKAAEERKREVLAAAEAHRAEAIRAVMETVI